MNTVVKIRQASLFRVMFLKMFPNLAFVYFLFINTTKILLCLEYVLKLTRFVMKDKHRLVSTGKVALFPLDPVKIK